ncbi:MAG: M6 family metalloprotease domain-containing protein [Muribaculaceae bacterium]|nr:M6 family metalloprotease domain-containing protein [Muribaculaceae bacterium]
MKRLLLSILASGICAGAMAIPAKPGLIAYTQPDGTVINVRIVGDEHGHMVYSESGLLLAEANDGRLEYARFDSNGFPIPSGIAVGQSIDEKSLAARLQPENLINGWIDKVTVNSRERVEKLKEVASRIKVTRSGDDLTDEGESRLVPLNFARCEATFPVLGEQKGLVVLVEYEDITFDYGDYDYFNRMLNEEGFSDFGSLGSARDWFIENSNGRFIPEFDVYGPVKLPNPRQYYGGNDVYGNDMHPEEMAIHACQILDEQVDFSQYDRDGDGLIDNVFIFYAGKGEHDSKIKNAVWPHSWDIAANYPDKEFVFDGVKLGHYACTCEYPSGYKRPDGIGTFVHEFSHVMGLPDLYVTTYTSGFTPGEWSVMDQGPYNNDRLTPPNYSSYEKCALGWLDFKPFSEGRMEIPDLSSTNEAYAMPTEKENEFFFFENRQQHGNDEFLPGHGMLVWHVDYKESVWRLNTVNNTANHQYVDLIEADNVKSAATRAADVFPGPKGVTSYGFDTKPQLASWAKKRLDFDLTDIAESEDGIISFNAVKYDPNAVETVESANATDAIYYDLMGRRIANPGKGIYIHNGKKVLVKD